VALTPTTWLRDSSGYNSVRSWSVVKLGILRKFNTTSSVAALPALPGVIPSTGAKSESIKSRSRIARSARHKVTEPISSHGHRMSTLHLPQHISQTMTGCSLEDEKVNSPGQLQHSYNSNKVAPRISKLLPTSFHRVKKRLESNTVFHGSKGSDQEYRRSKPVSIWGKEMDCTKCVILREMYAVAVRKIAAKLDRHLTKWDENLSYKTNEINEAHNCRYSV